MCMLCMREGGGGGAVSARGSAWQQCRRPLALPLLLIAMDGEITAEAAVVCLCATVATAAAAAAQASAVAATLSAAAAEGEGAGRRALRVRLPQIRSATLRQVIDFCRRHRNVQGDARAVELMWQRFASLPADDVSALARAARYLQLKPMQNLCVYM